MVEMYNEMYMKGTCRWASQTSSKITVQNKNTAFQKRILYRIRITIGPLNNLCFFRSKKEMKFSTVVSVTPFSVSGDATFSWTNWLQWRNEGTSCANAWRRIPSLSDVVFWNNRWHVNCGHICQQFHLCFWCTACCWTGFTTGRSAQERKLPRTERLLSWQNSRGLAEAACRARLVMRVVWAWLNPG